MSARDGRPAKVVVWRDYWLAPSETFIRDQVASLQRWQPVTVGRRQFSRTLVTADHAPYGDSLAGRVLSLLPPAPQVSRGYRDVFADPEVAVVHAHFGPDGVRALRHARRAGKPLLVTFHGMDVTALPNRRWAGRRYRRQLTALFAGAHTLIAVSEFIAGQLEALGAPREKIAVHYIGTDVPAARQAAAERRGILFVGRLVEKKGVADLFRAVADLPGELARTPVTVVGYGPLRAQLEQRAAETGVDARFLGRRSSAEISDLLAQHAVFCAPSRRAADGDSEGFGMVFLEAAAAELPVASYRHGGIGEAVVDGTTGLLADEGDVAGLSAALRTLLTDPDLARRLGRAGRERVVAEFDVRERTAELEKLYDAAAAQSLVEVGDRAGA
ncbi:glycosyltransferase [Nakamurella endophytica]|uniref:Glucosyltransferase n=1 Tax=Nakamurella endophytica TaxID=1748367 RepID=A0A917WC15_9ACTN|nr:glycosyltransferase [Nakamurella endophytica]GGL91404.1 glucosyltransferase [Nakamurella endophytica]